MGCDINGVLQKREPNTNEWTTFAPIERFFNGRSYLLFGILAGVRNSYVEIISDNRGLPEGFELDDTDFHHHKLWPEYYYDYYDIADIDGTTWMGEHNFGWVEFREFLDYNWKQESRDHEGEPTSLGIMFSYLHRDVYKICVEEKAQPEDLRMVFGFDS